MKTLPEWLSYLEQLHPSAIDMGLERVAKVKDALGLSPAFPLLTVTGTNGKGSVCAMLEAALLAADYRVGCYTSPHLLRYNERVRINGIEADDAALCQAFAAIEASRGDTSLTYFEFGTLAAMQLFMQAQVDVAILEVGLGGRLDAVNVFDADCAVITSIDLDHASYLGDTRELVAREKAGIMRGGKAAVCAEPNPPAVIADTARQLGAQLYQVGPDYRYEATDGGWLLHVPGGHLSGLPLPAMRGQYQLANAAAALMALWCLRERLPVGVKAMREGLLAARVAGRFQLLPGQPQRILDVGHNPHAARALAHNLASLPPSGRVLAVFAMLADKDHEAVISALRPHIDDWYVAGLEGARGMSAEALAGRLYAAGVAADRVQLGASVADAYQLACRAAHENDKILVFGSFHTVADVLASLSAAETTE